jgi:hypothetical protein
VEEYIKLPKKVKTFLGSYVRNKIASSRDSKEGKSERLDDSPMRMHEIDSNDQHSMSSQM